MSAEHRTSHTSPETWTVHRVLDALTLVAWFFYRLLRGEMAQKEIQEQAETAIANWQQHLTQIASPDIGSVIGGFSTLTSSRELKRLLQQTVFVPTSGEQFRFSHREWQDFLVARYLALCIRHRYLMELRHIGYTTSHFIRAAEILSSEEVSDRLVEDAFTLTAQTGERFIIGNFGGFLANSRSPIGGPAIRRIVDSFPQMESVARHVFLGGLCYRAYQSEKTDSAAVDIREALLPILPIYSAPGGPWNVDPVTASMVWCSTSALSRRFKMPPPSGSWPSLGGYEHELAALRMCAACVNGRWTVTAHHRSLQMAWLRVQDDVVVSPQGRSFGAIHYLYCCAVARKHGAQIPELGAQLPVLLDERSPYGQKYTSQDVIPEVSKLYRHCQQLTAFNPPVQPTSRGIRIRWELKLASSVSVLETLLAELRRLSADTTLELHEVFSSPPRIRLEGAIEGYERLRKGFDTKVITEVSGLPIRDILPTLGNRQIRLFIFFAPKDREHFSELLRNLSVLKKSGNVTLWSPEEIPAGADRRVTIERELEASNVVLLLMSPDFIYSDECGDVEQLALRRRQEGKLTVVPLLLRHCSYEYSESFRNGIALLPRNQQPITRWDDPDEVQTEITREVGKLIASLDVC